MSKQNKEELIKEKQALVSQFNILQEKLNTQNHYLCYIVHVFVQI